MITVEKILQDRTMVSLTLMLVIATISASIQQVSGDVQLFLERLISHPVSVIFSLQSLPATPYFKMIDIWLFFTMNLMVVSHLERTRSRKQLKLRFSASSSTPTWSMSSKLWSSGRRGANKTTFNSILNTHFNTTYNTSFNTT